MIQSWVTCKTNCFSAWLEIRNLLRHTVCRYIHIMHTCDADAATCLHSRYVYIICHQLWCYVCTPDKFYSLFLEMLFGSVGSPNWLVKVILSDSCEIAQVQIKRCNDDVVKFQWIVLLALNLWHYRLFNIHICLCILV